MQGNGIQKGTAKEKSGDGEMKIRIIMEINTVLYEKEYGVKITDPDAMMKNLSAGLIPPGSKSIKVTVEK